MTELLNDYNYSSSSISTVTTIGTLPIPLVTTDNLNTLVGIINLEVQDLSNFIYGNVTTTNYNSDGSIQSVSKAAISSDLVLSQIVDLQYRLMLYSNNATTQDELSLVSSINSQISNWKSLLTQSNSNTSVSPSKASTDPDFNIFMTWYNLIMSIKVLLYSGMASPPDKSIMNSTLNMYVLNLNAIYSSLNLKYPNDQTLGSLNSNASSAINALEKAYPAP